MIPAGRCCHRQRDGSHQHQPVNCSEVFFPCIVGQAVQCHRILRLPLAVFSGILCQAEAIEVWAVLAAAINQRTGYKLLLFPSRDSMHGKTHAYTPCW